MRTRSSGTSCSWRGVRRAASELRWRLHDEVRLDGAEIERIYTDAALAPD